MIYKTLEPTKRYADFSFFYENRGINNAHVEGLADQVDFSYMLDLFPAVADDNGKIYDGQHRYIVAKEYKLPFYVLRSGGISVHDIAEANGNTLAITNNHALFSYSRMGLPQYAIADKFRESRSHLSKVHAGYTRELLQYDGMDGTARQFETGEFRVTTYAFAAESYKKLKEFFDIMPGHKYVSPYRKVLLRLFAQEDYDHNRMLSNASRIPTRIFPCSKESDALAVLNDIYNYGMRSSSRVVLVAPTVREGVAVDDAVVYEDRVSPRAVVNKPICIYVERDLGRFCIPDWARANYLDNRTQDSLTKYVGQKDMLSLYPIIVSPSNIVLDGGRRLLAARALGKPIYYIVSEDVDEFMVFRANASRKSWSLDSYLESYKKIGRQEYIAFSAIMEQVKDVVPMGLAIRILSGFHYGITADNRFKSGEHQNTHRGDLYRLCAAARRIESISLRKNRTLQMSLLHLMGQDSFDIDRAIAKINEFEGDMLFASRNECIAVLNDVYNRHKKNKVYLPRLA